MAGQNLTEDQQRTAAGCGGIAAIVLVLIVAWSFIAQSCKSDDQRAEEDSSLACDHFHNVAADYADGILTPTELRTKLREINDNASIATPRIQAAATAMLREVTSGTDDSLADAVREMGAACAAVGN